jgi:multidrug resistance efflux pump
VERPPEIRQALRVVTTYLDQLEQDLAAERRARQLLELKLKAAQAAAPSRQQSRPARVAAQGTPRAQALALLGLVGSPSEQEIRQAYRQRARDLHPDAAGGSAEGFQELTAAAELLLLLLLDCVS